MVSAYVTGAEAEIASVFQETGTPAIATFASNPPAAADTNPYVFYLDSGAKVDPRAAWERTAASGELVVEAMRRAGRGLTRSGLIEALEGMSRVKGSFPEPLSFGPNRRIGSKQ